MSHTGSIVEYLVSSWWYCILEVVETSGDGVYLEEVAYWRHDVEV
jgi:hypothetical protein